MQVGAKRQDKKGVWRWAAGTLGVTDLSPDNPVPVGGL